MNIMQALKAGTKEAHDSIEGLAYSHKIMSGTIEASEYKSLILKNYWLHSLVESAISRALTDQEKQEVQFKERKKLGFLYSDLEELGMLRHIKLPAENNLPHFSIRSFSEAMGAMYVLEGATLGGAIIRRELLKIPEISHISSLHYYTCYGREIGSYWKAFMQYMAQHLTQEDEIQSAVAKAQETFELFAHLLRLEANTEREQAYISIAPVEERLKSA